VKYNDFLKSFSKRKSYVNIDNVINLKFLSFRSFKAFKFSSLKFSTNPIFQFQIFSDKISPKTLPNPNDVEQLNRLINVGE
jgi:hypothetical protein